MAISRALLNRPSRTHGASLMMALGLSESRHDAPPLWIGTAIQSIARLWPVMILGRVVATLAGGMFPPMATLATAPVLGALVLVLVTDALLCAGFRLSRFCGLRPHVQMRLTLAVMMLSGAAFSFLLVLLSGPLPDGGRAVSAAASSAAMLAICICGSRRVLGLGYIAGTGAVIAASQGGLTLWGILAMLLLAIGAITLWQARADQHRLQARHARDYRGRRAEALVRDHELSGRGWFWETDRNGKISYISETLARSLGTTSEGLVGKPLVDLVGRGEWQKGDGERTLGFHLSARTAFIDIPVHVKRGEEDRAWAISGQPIVDDYGQFQGFRGSGADLTEMRRSQAEVNRLAQYDSLTGLANRVQMMRTLEQAVLGNRGLPGECALFLLDLDRFKGVNDTLGHPAGDQLLRNVSQRLQQVIGERGRVGRLGGDEFKVVLPGATDRRMLATLADAVIASLSQPYAIDGHQVVIGASVGIALCPADGVTTDALIRNADLALYAAKGDGRGVHRFYAADMHADAEDRRQLEHDLRQALAADGLRLVYQPVVSAAQERISGFEALLRWEHPVRGAISPADFIPIAEDAGLISQIGEWVLRTACRDAAIWPEDIKVAVNVSPIQFANPAFPGIVVSALASAGLAAQRLELEITESVFLNDDADSDAMFARLKQIGVRLALDDFGTGYSSLGYLKKAPFDKIKIDQSFVRGAAIAGSRNSAIIKSIVSLAEALSMDTTAEGVETHDELTLVRSLGCSHVQGYIYGKAQDALATMEMLRAVGTLAEADGFRSSRPVRKSMFRSVAVLHDGHRYTGRIRNISSTGALIEGLWNVPDGTCFRVELAEGYVLEALCRWSVEDRMGIEFLVQADLERMRATVPQRALAS
ncbi:putative bifunctional diguanylate cyclase/phosphodiesterase [Sphingobium algorifonticola]|uniref:GGDEF and EAL domain-containing protein n=1 Tax=Sphingobium algorifonticola TaxID=2008318 RepID=A0A437JCP4_9SPHN|nr:EAL domain-containing protein [Sphingobium algorifonticola]RVT43698.1 GGDEF and EAL domain-containing protein [Sphingobium algorifonticola]